MTFGHEHHDGNAWVNVTQAFLLFSLSLSPSLSLWPPFALRGAVLFCARRVGFKGPAKSGELSVAKVGIWCF